MSLKRSYMKVLSDSEIGCLEKHLRGNSFFYAAWRRIVFRLLHFLGLSEGKIDARMGPF